MSNVQTFKSLSAAMSAIQRTENEKCVQQAANLRRSAPLAANRPKGSGPRIARPVNRNGR